MGGKLHLEVGDEATPVVMPPLRIPWQLRSFLPLHSMV